MLYLHRDKEGYVIEEVTAQAGAYRSYYYRTHHETECAPLLVDALKLVIAVGIIS